MCLTLLFYLINLHILIYFLCFFFFSSRRRHTRLQGDWSSDVCSSDLEFIHVNARNAPRLPNTSNIMVDYAEGEGLVISLDLRSEERRVGKECRSRWSPYH